MSKRDHPLDYRGFIFDVDGVICRGDELIPGADEAIAHLRRAGKRVIFISNNSTKSRKGYLEKFSRLGISVSPEELVLSTYATAQYVARERPGAKVYMIGAPGLREELEEAGLQLTDEPLETEYVVVGSPFDGNGRITEENTWRITGALRALYHMKAKYIATNPDRIFPAQDGVIPGTGAVIGALNYMVGREPDVIIGKPSELIVRIALEKMGLDAKECVIVGDMDTDMLAGKRTGMTTVFVQSGAMTEGELGRLGIEPDFIYPSIAEMVGV